MSAKAGSAAAKDHVRDHVKDDTKDDAIGNARARRRVPWLALAPLALFLALAGVFAAQLLSGRDASVLPSPLIGQPAPSLALPALPGITGPDGAPLPAPDALAAALPGDGVRLVNAFASWCAPCRAEHAQLIALAARDDLALIGLATKDEPAASARFLAELGNPFDAVGVDREGRAMIDWGVTKLPESHVVAPDGTIVHKHTGPILPEHMPGLVAAIEAAGAVR